MNSALRNRFHSDGVASMSQERLLIALYERLVVDLDKAVAAIGATKPADAHERLVHAQTILEELHLALDRDAWDGAENLASLYQYAIDKLVQANLRKDVTPVLEVKALIEPLVASWREAYEQLSGIRASKAATAVAEAREPAAVGTRRIEFGA